MESEQLNPNSEVTTAKQTGSTGSQPVPSGYQPLGMTARLELSRAALAKGGRLVIPSGRRPDGTGW
jgi:hypothetical protein